MRKWHVKSRGLALVLAAGLLTVPALASATVLKYDATLMPRSMMGSGSMGSGSMGSGSMGSCSMGSGSMAASMGLCATGHARLWYNTVANTLMVHIIASGLVGNEYHPQHIHESMNGMPDMNPAFGLVSSPGDNDNVNSLFSYPKIGLNGKLNFTRTYSLSDKSNLYFSGFDEKNLLPLSNDFIMLHGINSAKGYEPDVMAAMGAIHSVPEPSSIFDMLAGLGAMLALVGFGRRRMRRRKAC